MVRALMDSRFVFFCPQCMHNTAHTVSIIEVNLLTKIAVICEARLHERQLDIVDLVLLNAEREEEEFASHTKEDSERS